MPLVIFRIRVEHRQRVEHARGTGLLCGKIAQRRAALTCNLGNHTRATCARCIAGASSHRASGEGLHRQPHAQAFTRGCKFSAQHAIRRNLRHCGSHRRMHLKKSRRRFDGARQIRRAFFRHGQRFAHQFGNTLVRRGHAYHARSRGRVAQQQAALRVVARRIPRHVRGKLRLGEHRAQIGYERNAQAIFMARHRQLRITQHQLHRCIHIFREKHQRVPHQRRQRTVRINLVRHAADALERAAYLRIARRQCVCFGQACVRCALAFVPATRPALLLPRRHAEHGVTMHRNHPRQPRIVGVHALGIGQRGNGRQRAPPGLLVGEGRSQRVHRLAGGTFAAQDRNR